MTRSRNYIATPPGATIKEQLMERGMSQKEFAARMDMSEKHISKLINGDVQLTTEAAIRLEMVLGVPAKFWTNLECIYREKLAKVEAENLMEQDEKLARNFPYAEMAKYEWVPFTRNAKEKVVNLRKYFGVVRLELLEESQITRIACRRLAISAKSDLALMAWAQEAKNEARSIDVSPIDVKGLVNSLNNIRNMTLLDSDMFAQKLRIELSEFGIVLVFLPHLKGSFLHGATFYDGNRIVIGMTTRGHDADKFWFSLFHELGHIVLGHVSQLAGTTDEDETAADNWAKEQLIPSITFDKFISEGSFTADTICQYARSIGISPGIVVGRLQNEGIIKFNMHNSLKDKYILT